LGPYGLRTQALSGGDVLRHLAEGTQGAVWASTTLTLGSLAST
jgi:hypothetical protein